MSQLPFQFAESLRIATVDFVSPDEIKVVLDIEAPESVALNAGGPRPFPRVNGYVLIPVEDVLLVGQIEWLTVERSAFPKRRGMQDFGLVDLPYPLRKISLNPVGTLRKCIAKQDEIEVYNFSRGVEAFPSIGAAVLLPTDTQLRSIVESGERRRVKIGTSPLAGHAEVRIDPDRLFGRHLAVLGNTGSGKSCSVAGLIRWSLQQAHTLSGKTPNARVVVLDPNGEYSTAFADDDTFLKPRVFKVSPDVLRGEHVLQVPLWFWNSAEWCSFTQASAKSQRPLLKRALREIKSGRVGLQLGSEDESRLNLRKYLSSTMVTLSGSVHSGAIRREPKFGKYLDAVFNDLTNRQSALCDLQPVLETLAEALESNRRSFTKHSETIVHFDPFAESQIQPIIGALGGCLKRLGGGVALDGPDEDVPVQFSGNDFADHLEVLAEHEGVSQFLDFLVARIRTFLADSRMKAVVSADDDVTLEEWLSDYIGSYSDGQCITILDLSLVPSEVIHVITAVVGRMIFEALQRYRKINKVTLPTVLVVEEAHSFVRRYKDEVENLDAASVCCQVFERIAREGRKFGLGLLLSSQRPSELSPTVLSQCNSFLLHRISNDRDQEIVHRLVPDNLRGLLRELPSLPSQNAILLGWASELPVLVKMNDLPKSQRPHSDDPDFWDVWTGTMPDGTVVDRPADWQPVADDWQGRGQEITEPESEDDK